VVEIFSNRMAALQLRNQGRNGLESAKSGH
jgi:hypothetical protein